jgi:hypothetical protein
MGEEKMAAFRRAGVIGIVVVAAAGAAVAGLAATADPGPARYPWMNHAAHSTLAERIAPPAGATRVAVTPESFADWLRRLPMMPPEQLVHLYDGSLKPRQDVHHAVVDLDVARRDLQQCADAVMRLWAEYLFATGQTDRIRFHPEPGKKKEIAWWGGRRRAGWSMYLTKVFADAGTASLEAELPVADGKVQPGDVLIQGGHPGHAVLVLDVAESAAGERYLLIGQSYMPAQQFHVVKNLGDDKLSPWFKESDLDTASGLKTPEWRAFSRKQVRRFK